MLYVRTQPTSQRLRQIARRACLDRSQCQTPFAFLLRSKASSQYTIHLMRISTRTRQTSKLASCMRLSMSNLYCRACVLIIATVRVTGLADENEDCMASGVAELSSCSWNSFECISGECDCDVDIYVYFDKLLRNTRFVAGTTPDCW